MKFSHGQKLMLIRVFLSYHFLNYLSTVRVTTTLSISKKALALIMMHSEKEIIVTMITTHSL